MDNLPRPKVTTADTSAKLNLVSSIFNEIDLRRIDLNLLVVFAALMRERSVRGAAKRLLLGPSAVSMALGRLRELFADPLFVRARAAMEPTGRAEALYEALAPALGAVREAVLATAVFDPARDERVLRFASPDDLEIALLPELLVALRRRAPGIRLVVRPSDFRVVPSMLDAGEVDLALLATPSSLERRHKHEVLYEERLASVFDPRRLGTRGPLDRELFLRTPHVLQSASGVLRGQLDDRLAAGGHRRRVVAAVAHFATLPLVLRRMRVLANMPSVAAHYLAKSFRLATSPLPFESPTFGITLAWHARSEHDAAIAWLRGLVREIALALRAAVPLPKAAPRRRRRPRSAPAGGRPRPR